MSFTNFKYLIGIIAIVVFFACGSREGKRDHKEDKKSVKSGDLVQKKTYSTIPLQIFKIIYTESDYMDVIFEDLPFSMSQDNNPGIRKLLNYVDNAPLDVINANCKPMGNQVFQRGGEIIAEADFYVSPGCNYYVFSYKGRKFYNQMTEAGVQFYSNLKTGKFEN